MGDGWPGGHGAAWAETQTRSGQWFSFAMAAAHPLPTCQTPASPRMYTSAPGRPCPAVDGWCSGTGERKENAEELLPPLPLQSEIPASGKGKE